VFLGLLLFVVAFYIVYRLLANADPKSTLISGTKKIYAYRRLHRKKRRHKKKKQKGSEDLPPASDIKPNPE
jgi:hypothetical protein